MISLACSDGVSLEGELRVPDTSSPWAAVVLLHPHPRFGGTMRTGVPSVLFDALPDAGVAALRFNFRGVEGSGGAHGDGVDERLDVVAAIDALHPIVEGLPLVLAGWSFGGDVRCRWTTHVSQGGSRSRRRCGCSRRLPTTSPESMVGRRSSRCRSTTSTAIRRAFER